MAREPKAMRRRHLEGACGKRELVAVFVKEPWSLVSSMFSGVDLLSLSSQRFGDHSKLICAFSCISANTILFALPQFTGCSIVSV